MFQKCHAHYSNLEHGHVHLNYINLLLLSPLSRLPVAALLMVAAALLWFTDFVLLPVFQHGILLTANAYLLGPLVPPLACQLLSLLKIQHVPKLFLLCQSSIAPGTLLSSLCYYIVT